MRGSQFLGHPGFPFTLFTAVILVAACASGANRYALVDRHLSSNDAPGAAQIIQQAKDEYGSKSRVQYEMDLGMTLHLAGEWKASNEHLEQAEAAIEDLYTRRIGTEARAFFVNDSQLPFEGEPFEQVWVNVVKALNYALLGAWDDALVEARRIDHRLNVLADRVDEDHYRNDAFARYLSGILYESTGDLNNAFIAYRQAYEAYRASRAWSRTPIPATLRGDLLRITDALHLADEHEAYRREFGDVAWRSWSEVKDLAHVIVISYNGRAPRTEDQFLDLPVSLDALKLVLLTKSATRGANNADTRVAESILYGLSGRIVRVALPKLVPQKTQVARSEVNLSGPNGPQQSTTELVSNITATAEKALDDRFTALATKAVARAASKFVLAEGAERGVRHAAGDETGPWLGLLVRVLTKTLAVATESADKRSWRTLPDEIHLTRFWVPAGEYTLAVRPIGARGDEVSATSRNVIRLGRGQTRIVVERIVS